MVLSWSSNPAEQKLFVKQLDLKLAQLDRLVVPETIYSETEPLDSAITGNLYKKTQWVVPSTNELKNIYTKVDDAAVANTSTLAPYAIVPVPQSDLLTVIDSYHAGNANGLSTISFSGIPQTFSRLFLYLHYRDTVAATSISGSLRVNGLASATYAMSWFGHNGTQSYGNESVGATGWVIGGPGGTADNHLWLDGWFEFPTYTDSLAKRMRGRAHFSWGTPTTSTFQAYNIFGGHSPTTAITSVSWTGNVGSAPGTRAVLFGM